MMMIKTCIYIIFMLGREEKILCLKGIHYDEKTLYSTTCVL